MEVSYGQRSIGNTITLYQGGKQYFETFYARIKEAKTFIHIQVYILAKDTTGLRLLDALFEAADRGVRVFLMLDAFGSSWVRKEEIREWKSKGLHVKLFSRRLRFRRLVLGRRQHSKIVVIDNAWMSIGGLNFADRYSGFDETAPWLDAAAWVYGPAASVLNRRSAVYWPRKVRRYLRNQPAVLPQVKGVSVTLLINDWLRNRFEVRNAYREAIEKSEKEILLLAAYFFPSPRMLRRLVEKAEAGVKVRLVFSSVSDVPFVKAATEHFYGRLQRAGVEIYEWQESVLHAKVALIDNAWFTLGSYNLNQLSDFGSLETNMAIDDPQLARLLLNQFEEHIYPKSEQLDPVIFSWYARIKQFISYLVLRFALSLIYIANRHKR